MSRILRIFCTTNLLKMCVGQRQKGWTFASKHQYKQTKKKITSQLSNIQISIQIYHGDQSPVSGWLAAQKDDYVMQLWGCYELALPQFLSLAGALSCFAPALCRYKQATSATCKTADAAESSAWWRCCHSLIRFLGNSSHCSAFGLWCE